MATGTGQGTVAAATPAATGCAYGLPVPEGGDARVETGSEAGSETGSEAGREASREAGSMSPIIEVSDKDYRSFCFPCHALEEVTDCNAGY